MIKKNIVKKRIAGTIVYMIISAVAGIAAWIVGEILFDSLTQKVFTPIGILLYFLIAYIIISLVLIALLIKKLTVADFKHKIRSTCKLLLIILLAFLLTTGLFEFLYELGKTEIPEPTSLIFLIDDSGSMDGNEADRVKALNDVMKNNNLPFAVYSFTNHAQQLRNMEFYSATLTEQDLSFQSNGGTEIIASIKDVLRDLEQGSIKNAGLSPKILLVSDGGSSSFGLRSMTKSCRKQMVSVSSIGMIGSSEGLLKRIAEATGGVYVSCTDVTALGTDLTKAVASDTDRNLLSERIVYNHNGLYAVLRILFLSLMGLVWSLMKTMLLSEEKKLRKKAFVYSVILCVSGSLIVEFGSAAGISIVLLRLLFDVLWAITYGTLPKKTVAIEPTENRNPPIVSDVKMRVDRLSSDTTDIGGVKRLSGKNGTDGNSINEGKFGLNNQGNGLFGNVNSDEQNSSRGLFDEKKDTGKSSGLFGGNKGNNGGNGFFGN